jgi:uncharacterized membrane protein (UPF0136 family)
MQISAILLLIYGVLVGAGGVLGYVKAGSRPSLVSGSAFCIIIILGAILALQGWRGGIVLDLLAALLVLLLFIYRLSATGKKMPAVPVILLSALAILVAVLALTIGV